MADRNYLNIPLKLPEFHGDSINYPGENWQRYKANIALAYKVAGVEEKLTNAQRAAHLLQGLKGKALNYLEEYPELHEKGYEEVDLLLANKFEGTSLAGLMEMGQIVQKPGESVRAFLNRLMRAAGAIEKDPHVVEVVESKKPLKEEDFGGEDKNVTKVQPMEQYEQERRALREAAKKLVFPHFLRGLRQEFRAVLMSKKPTMLDEAVKMAEEHEAYMENYGALGMPEIRNLEAGEPDQALVNKIAEQLKSLNVTHSSSQVNQVGQSPNNSRSVETRSCHYCGEAGHLVRFCKFRRQDRDRDIRRQEQSRWDAAPMQRRVRDLRSQSPHGGRAQPPRNQGKNSSPNNPVRFTIEKRRQMEKNGRSPPQKERGGLKVPSPILKSPKGQTQNARQRY